MEKELINRLYKIVDSFLVEAKDQNGNERSIERLNQDRHLAVKKLDELFKEKREDTIKEIDNIDFYGWDEATQRMIKDKIKIIIK